MSTSWAGQGNRSASWIARHPALESHGGGTWECGIATIEALFVAMMVGIVVLGASVAFSAQRHTALEVTLPENLRDAVSAVDVDLSALGSYDPTFSAKVNAGGQQLWTAPVPGQGTAQLATLQAKPAGAGISVSARAGAQQASVIAPLVVPKPTPT